MQDVQQRGRANYGFSMQDLEAMASGKTEIYSTLNLVMRRKPTLGDGNNSVVIAVDDLRKLKRRCLTCCVTWYR